MTLREMLQFARERSGLKQSELGREIGLGQNSISRIENGPHNTTFEKIDSWIGACGFRMMVVPVDARSVERFEMLPEHARDLVTRLAAVAGDLHPDGLVALEALLSVWESRQESSASATAQDNRASLSGSDSRRLKSS